MASVPMLATQIAPLPESPDLMGDLLRLQKASQRISSLLDLDQLIERIVNEIACSFGLVEANVYLYEPDREELLLACVHGCTVYDKGHCLKLGKEGLVGYVASTGQMRYAPDVRVDPYYLPCEESTLSEVAIPLLVEEQLVGVFTASHPELNAFQPQQLKILQGLCSHIAVAVQNARLFQQVQHERELSQAIARLSQLREELKSAIDADAESYNAVMKAYKQAKDSAGADSIIEAALKQATSVPLSVAERAREVAGIVEGLQPITNPNMKSDLTTATALARAAIQGALANVDINLESLKDTAFAAETRKRAAALTS